MSAFSALHSPDPRAPGGRAECNRNSWDRSRRTAFRPDRRPLSAARRGCSPPRPPSSRRRYRRSASPSPASRRSRARAPPSQAFSAPPRPRSSPPQAAPPARDKGISPRSRLSSTRSRSSFSFPRLIPELSCLFCRTVRLCFLIIHYTFSFFKPRATAGNARRNDRGSTLSKCSVRSRGSGREHASGGVLDGI